MSQQYIFTMHRLQKALGTGQVVLEDVSLSFLPGAKIGVLGENGAGKSTLLRIMAGVDAEYSGTAELAPGATVGLLEQEPRLDHEKDVRGNVEDGLGRARDLLRRFEELSAKLGEPLSGDEMADVLDEQGRVQDEIEAADGWSLERKLDVAMDALRVPAGDRDVTELSGGERRRVALCRLLLGAPDLLLLDEPTNHLDAESVAWLERHLAEYRGTVVLVTHDRYFLDEVCGWILELDRGRGIPYRGNYSGWLEQKRQRLEQEEGERSARERELARELEWTRMNAGKREARSKARITAYERLASEAEAADERVGRAQITVPASNRLGDLVIEAEGLTKAYGDTLLFEDLSFSLPPGGIVGVIGPNGAGKTTLLRILVGQESPDAGTLRIGDSVELSYVDQDRDVLHDDRTVWEEISDKQDTILLGRREVRSRAYVATFNFRGPAQQKRVGDLSGGERNRVHLAKLLRRGGNVLLLDEPTNDLDVDTLRELESGLEEFPGCAVVISHDRWFLDRLATHILAFEGDSRVVWFEGNYARYEESRRRRLGEAADRPHRIRYRRLAAQAP
ncbi:MAG TPA: energy-dependent translational throttle protein EttA [Thermoleophilaceae bacterium]|nr:energy-dependent translational throttle protein EttA [Thermoleophilaceae bacterium]